MLATRRASQVSHLKNEVRLLGSVSHPGLVALLGAYQDQHSVYLAMEYAPGTPGGKEKRKKITAPAAQQRCHHDARRHTRGERKRERKRL